MGAMKPRVGPRPAWWSCCAVLPAVWRLLVCGVLLGGGLSHAADDVQCTMPSPYCHEPAYAMAAIANWTDWRSTYFTRVTQARADTPVEDRLQNHWVYDTIEPFIGCPPGQQIESYGRKRGIKWTCGYPTDDPNCVVYSLGSNMDFQFEKDVLNRTLCKVHTFDCSCDGHSIHPRHEFHKICIGTNQFVYAKALKHATRDQLKFMPMQDIMKMLGHVEVTSMKIDIEGSEYGVIGQWKASDPHLPLQLNLEVHVRENKFGKVRDPFDIPLFISHVVNLGYAIAYKDNNPYSERCTELLLLRVFGPVPGRP